MMDNENLAMRESSGGYSKSAVLLKLDAYYTLLSLLEAKDISYSDAKAKYNSVKYTELKKVGRFHKGYDVIDTEEVIRAYEEKIDKYMDELKEQ